MQPINQLIESPSALLDVYPAWKTGFIWGAAHRQPEDYLVEQWYRMGRMYALPHNRRGLVLLIAKGYL